ncbi:histidine kinase group protein [Sporothrix schenckii 1099-18]|uniref:Histidine kinase n=2 Tax=Sporothrix schenckii TaxID=29908 RepID=U7PVL9_SPOS1|nr:histidine kinase group protein [Sporothrix schenckii 1099-18]ERS99698.1 hypothetical protein HMPREF1624_03061 [Sporothrix schenckii ATCC 58251]KJR85937.1 histidine kinase group protein [Sporothrix schenckii 1099-18]
MPVENETTGRPVDHARLSSSSVTRPSSVATSAKERLRLSRGAAPVVSTPAHSVTSPTEQPSSPTSSSSSLFSSVASHSSFSTTYQPVPAWIASEISRNVLAPTHEFPGYTAVAGAAGCSARGGACCGGGASGGLADADTPRSVSSPSHPPCPHPSSLFRPRSYSMAMQPYLASAPAAGLPDSRAAVDIPEQRASLRSKIITPSDFNGETSSIPGLGALDDEDGQKGQNGQNRDNGQGEFQDDVSAADGLLTAAAKTGRLRDEPENEVVRKQFLAKGNVSQGTMANGECKSTQSSSPATSASGTPQIPQPASFLSQNADLVELLNQDDRPTFLVDACATDSEQMDKPWAVVFANTALKALPSILVKLSSTDHDDALSQFKNWALRLTPESAALNQDPASFAGWRWSASTLRRRFRVIRGLGFEAPVPPSQPSPLVGSSTTATIAAAGEPDLPAQKSPPQDEAISLPSLTAGDDCSSTAAPTAIDLGASLVPFPPLEDVKQSFDWTRIAVTDDMPAHIRFARSIDWASTPLGPIEHWPSDLRTMANLVVASPHPAAMYWGPSFTVIYNEAYTSLAGQKHPQLMGSPFAQSWSEIWDDLKPFFDSAWNAGQAVLKQDNHLFINRHGFCEETFFDWSLVPMVGSDGSVVGLFNPAFENTRRKVNERRMLTLNDVGEKTATAQTIPGFWQAAREGLEDNEYDVPFALIYSVVRTNNDNNNDNNDNNESQVSSTTPGTLPNPPQVVLEGSLGVPHDHPAAVHSLDLRTSEDGFAPYMRQSMSGSTTSAPSSTVLPPVVLSIENGTLPTELLAGLHGDRGFGDPCRTVVVIPVQHLTVTSDSTASSSSISGFIVMGTNPRLSYNRDYRLFVHLLARQLTTSLASVVLYEEEVRRSQWAARRAAQDRQELSHQLQIRTQQAVDSQNRFMRMAEFTPVGMFVTDNTGRITYCNDMWWKISRHPRQDVAASSPPSSSLTPVQVAAPLNNDASSVWGTWMDSVQDEDQPGLAVVWNRLVNDKCNVTHEFRFKEKTTIQTEGAEPIETTTWVLLRAYPEKDDQGNLKGIFGCITDISQQKLAEEFQIQLRKEAVEHKRQQENFIDITSHEMRNPLSAILQTVDEITNTVNELRRLAANGSTTEFNRAFDNIQEASSTITLCTNHQKRIVDDVLTLSKLDSQLLPVTPVDVQPVMVVRGTLKMFEAELLAHDINCTFRIQPSYLDLVGVGNWLRLDPSRLNQVLINLLTNAIKFTQSCEQRSIVVSLAASDGQCDPAENDVSSSIADVSYLPSRQDTPGIADGADWGNGQLINLHVAVSDTGNGLEDDEKNELFQHFLQTSPRTHVQYGGSGLGLYISRNLTELQGGQIGVASKKDEGSTFAFYVKSRKVPSTPAGVQPGASDISAIVSGSQSATDASAVVAYTSNRLKDGSGNCTCSTTVASTATVLPQLPSPPLMVESPFWPLAATEPRSHQCPSRDEAQAAPTPIISNAAISSLTKRSADDTNRASDVSPTLDVLIVEDNIVNQRVLQRQLDKCGNRTMVANHGGEALEILLQAASFGKANSDSGSAAGDEPASSVKGQPEATRVPSALAPASAAMAPSASSSGLRPLGSYVSIVLLDLEMPVMDGMTCARAIRALERSGTLPGHVPVIAVTAYARSEQIEAALAAGIDDVISKPFRLAQLTPKIQELVAKYPVALRPLAETAN